MKASWFGQGSAPEDWPTLDEQAGALPDPLEHLFGCWQGKGRGRAPVCVGAAERRTILGEEVGMGGRELLPTLSSWEEKREARLTQS